MKRKLLIFGFFLLSTFLFFMLIFGQQIKADTVDNNLPGTEIEEIKEIEVLKEEESVGIYARQKNITEEDVKQYITVMTKMMEVNNDLAQMKAIVLDSGWDTFRFAYVNERVNTTMEVIKGGEKIKEVLPLGIVPSAEEINLVKPYETELEALNVRALQNFKKETEKEYDHKE